jgi:hypothetical protein
MFLRKKTNKSSKTNMQVAMKTSDRKQNEVKTIGSSSDELEIERLVTEALRFIEESKGPTFLYFDENEAGNASTSLLMQHCWSWRGYSRPPIRISPYIGRKSLQGIYLPLHTSNQPQSRLKERCLG